MLAGSNLREAAEVACRDAGHSSSAARQGVSSRADDSSEYNCINRFTQAATAKAVAGNRSLGAGTRAVYYSRSGEPGVVCKPLRNGVRSEWGLGIASSVADADAVCARRGFSPLAFRWLKSAAPLGPLLFVPRHPRGQVLVSDDYRFIFVHVPKAASTTIRALLWDRGGIDNLIYSTQAGYKLATYLTFAFVRDPLKRFVSAYSEVCLKLGPTCAFYDTESTQGMRDFLAYTRQYPCWDEHVCDQMSFLRGEDGQLMRLDILASTDHIETTMLHISSVLDFEPPLSRGSFAPRNTGSLSARLRTLASDALVVRGVCALYAADYECLGFTLPEECRPETLAAMGEEEASKPGAEEEGAPQETSKLPSAIYPGEWHDSDLGVAALPHEASPPTQDLVEALTLHASRAAACAEKASPVLHAVCGGAGPVILDGKDAERGSASASAGQVLLLCH